MSDLADLVRQHDPDRYFCTLFAPAARRDALFTLYAFNHELARALEVSREPGLSLIRLQWWREVVEGSAKRHEVATPLAALIAAGEVPVAELLSMIEAREALAGDAPETLAAFMAAMKAGPGALAVAAGTILGASPNECADLRAVGAAYGVAGTLRNMPALARLARCPLPDDVLAAGGLSREQAIADPAAALASCGPSMRAAGLAALGAHRRWRRAVVAAALPGVLARRDLRRVKIVLARGAADRLAVMLAAATCML